MINKILLAGTFLAISVGCIPTKNLLRERGALPDELYEIATTMVARAQRVCIKISYNGSQSKDNWSKGRKLDLDDWIIKRFYKSDTDWYKAAALSQGVHGNLYYNTRTKQFVCGDNQWEKYSNANQVNFIEYGVVPKRLSGL